MTKSLSMALGLWLTLAVSGACQEPPEESDGAEPADTTGSLEVLADDTARAVGVVEANEQHCVVDAQCWLVVDLGSVTVKVIYVEAEGIETVNDTAADAGFAARPGDLVEVYGTYQPSPETPVLGTWARKDFYIKTLRRRSAP